MALIFADGFENVDPSISAYNGPGGGALLNARGWKTPNFTSTIPAISSTSPRWPGGKYINPQGALATGFPTGEVRLLAYIYPTNMTLLQAVTNGVTMGCAARNSSTNNYSGYGNSLVGFQLLNNSNNGNFFLGFYRSASLRCQVGGHYVLNSSTVDVAIDLIKDEDWHYYQVAIEPAGGTNFRVYFVVDNVIVYTTSVLNLTFSTTNQDLPLYAGFGSNGSSSYFNFDGVDDFYISDRTGSTNNEIFLGDVKVYHIPPISNNSVSFTKIGTYATNYETVARIDPTDAANYIYAASVGAQDTYNIQPLDMSINTSLRAVGVGNYMGVVTGASQGYKHVVTDGNQFSQSAEFIPTTTASTATVFNSTLWNVNPITNAPWLPSDVNTYKIGITRTV